MTELHVHPTAELPSIAAQRICAELDACLADGGTASLCLAGGGTYGPVYRELARQAQLDWSRVEIWFGDERCVPSDDPASNYHMARQTLLDPVAIPAERVHRMHGEDPDRDAAARAYAAALPPRLDLLLLGIGSDGHTASLFPGSAALSAEARVVAVTGPKPPPQRLTITPPVIALARRVIVVAAGEGKAEAVAATLAPTGNLARTPARCARHGCWLVSERIAPR